MPAGDAVAAATTKAAGKTARRPYHLGVFLGLSAGAYAVSLAGVTFLQSASERAIVAEQAPVASAAAVLASGHDAMQSRLDAGRSAYDAAGAGYKRVADELSAFEQQLDRLDATVASVAGTANQLPTRVALPSVPRAATPVAAAPKVVATTGASGKP